MLLAIDIGNTTVCIGGTKKSGKDDYSVSFTARLATDPRLSENAYLAQITSLLSESGISPDCLSGAVISSVVPALNESICGCARALTGKEPLVITNQSDLGISIALAEPEKAGRDRLVDAAWAAARYPLPAVTVDMGTATTFSIVDENRVFLGGLICAGVATGLNALTDKAAQLEPVRLETPEHLIGRNTTQCLCAGAVAGAAAMVDGLVQRIEEELGKPATLLITGGTASNAITYIAGGDVSLSVGMTIVSTLLAPIMTPLLTYLQAGAWVDVSLVAMIISVVKVILVPVLLGILIHKLLGGKMQSISSFVPLISVVAIVMIIAGIIANNVEKILTCGLLVLGVVVLHNLLGMGLGLLAARFFRVEYDKATAISIEVGMQNSGLAVSLATANFAANPLATLPGAIFSVWYNISGSIFASIRRMGTEKREKVSAEQ